MTKKRLIIISGGAIVLILVVVLVISQINKQLITAIPEATTTTPALFPAGEVRPDSVVSQNIITSPATTTPVNTGNEDNLTAGDRSGRFFRVATRPIGGLVQLGTGTTSVLVLVEKATGHLYRLVAGATSLERISNTTIPKIYRLVGGQTGTSTQIIFQYLKDNHIQTFSGALNLAQTGADFLSQNKELEPLAGNFLAPDISELVVAPKQDKLFWLETNSSETSGYLANLAGTKKELLFRSPYTEWRAAWATSTTLALQTRAAQSVVGSLYFIDLKTKKWEPVITNVPGLTTLVNPNLGSIIYSGGSDRGLVFGFYDVKKHFFGRLNLQTWADKCVWNQVGTIAYCAVPTSLPAGQQYPDDWYRGEVVLADNIWKIDAKTNQTEIVFSPATANLGETIDADNLLLSADETTLYLTNRHDSTLWALNLETGF